MPTDCLITLTVKPAPATDGETFLYHVDVDGQPIINNQTLAVKDAKEMRDLAASYGELFEQRFRPQLTDETLNTLGARLFDLWLGHGWAQIEANLGPGCRRWLVIASEVSEVLNLPWELLRPASDMRSGATPNGPCADFQGLSDRYRKPAGNFDRARFAFCSWRASRRAP